MLDKGTKQSIIDQNQIHDKDNGSTAVQIAILTEKISRLTSHLQSNRKDFHSRRGLIKMVAQRKKLLGYLKRTDLEAYSALIAKLDIRG